jgi:subtilase family serine protease
MMRTGTWHRRSAVVVLALAAWAVSAAGASAHTSSAAGGSSSRAVCKPVFSGASCYARIATNAAGQALTFARPSMATPNAGTPPFTPADIHTGYNLPVNSVVPQTIAIVDAFDDPTAESDLAFFNSTFGLPACTTANGCFRKLNQAGNAGPYPPFNSGWALEISLDIQWAHATCQNCKIILVEANSNSFADLAASVNKAAQLGANVISNSYGGNEFGGSFSAYQHKHVAITVSTGDNGYAAGTQFPASAPTVIAVGGTSLHLDSSSHYVSESAWSGAGSGCSSFYLAKKWQKNAPGQVCGTARGIADVSADADPNTGVYVYDTSISPPGWYQVGGTSLSAPIIGGVYALAGNAASVGFPSKIPYKNKTALHDITTGNNGSCGGSAICTAKIGWDGPTGMGTPNGIGGF